MSVQELDLLKKIQFYLKSLEKKAKRANNEKIGNKTQSYVGSKFN